MDSKHVICFLALVVGALALPTQEIPEKELPVYFYNTDRSSSRIVGGTEALIGSAPYMVALSTGTSFRSFFCGASLISQRTMMTAAHCTEAAFFGGSLLSSLAGTVGTNTWASGGQTYSIARNVSHPEYTLATVKNDICLLITADNVEFNNLVRPAVIGWNWVGAGVPVRANGWGRVIVNGPLSPTLLELRKVTVDGEVCQREVPIVAASLTPPLLAPPIDPAIEICTFHSAGHGMCNGDSGSGLVREASLELVGVVSWGLPCARGAPDMFARVSAYRPWIEQNVVN